MNWCHWFFWKWRNYLSKIGHVILKMLMVDQRPKMELLLMSPPASGEQVGTMWNFKTLASIPVLNVTVFNAWGRGMQNNSVWRMWMFWKSAGPLFSTTVLCGWGVVYHWFSATVFGILGRASQRMLLLTSTAVQKNEQTKKCWNRLKPTNSKSRRTGPSKQRSLKTQHSTTQHSTAQQNTAQHSTAEQTTT